MYEASEPYGKVKMNSYFPTQRAVSYLNYFQTAGWHESNPSYHQTYRDGQGGTLLLFTVRGKGVLHLHGSSRYFLVAGTVAIIPSNTPMEYFTFQNGPWEFYWANLWGDYPAQTARFLIDYRGPVFAAGKTAEYLKTIRYLIELPLEHTIQSELELSRNIAELMHAIGAEALGEDDCCSKTDPLAAKVSSYLEQHYSEPVHISGLCEIFFLSQNQLIRVFQSETGYTPYEYLKKYRLIKACELLQITDILVAEVSSRVGFSSKSNFIFQFRTEYGITPGQYRADLRKNTQAYDGKTLKKSFTR